MIKKNQTTPHFSQRVDDGSKDLPRGCDAAHHNQVASRKFGGDVKQKRERFLNAFAAGGGP
jgi:hypothetical protein